MKEFFKTYRFLIIALVLFSLGLLVYLAQLRDRREPVDRLFYVDYDEQVIRVVLNDTQGNEVRLEKTSEGWRLNEQYLVNEPALEDLLATLHHLRVRFPVPGAQQDQVLRDLEQQGILVQVYVSRHLVPLPGGKGLWPRPRLLRSIRVGADAAGGEGTYMMLPQKEQTPFVVHVPGMEAGVREVFMAREALWRDPVLIDLQPRQISRVQIQWIQHPERSFVLRANQQQPQILAGPQNVPLNEEHVDYTRLARYLSGFAGLYYERLLVQEPDTMMFGQPFMELEVVDHQDQATRLSFFRRKAPLDDSLLAARAEYDPDRFYIQLEDGQLALAQYFVFNRIMRPVSFFVVETEE